MHSRNHEDSIVLHADSSQFIPYLIEEYKRGNYPIDKLVTLYDVKDFETAIKDMKEGKALKAVLKWT